LSFIMLTSGRGLAGGNGQWRLAGLSVA
jgi:hypothetical protein